MQFRKAKKEDLEQIMRIENSAFHENYRETKDCYLDRIKYFNGGFVVAVENDLVVGFCSTEKWDAEPQEIKLGMPISKTHSNKGKILYISSIAISPEHQKKGIGSKLIKQIFEIANQNNCEQIALVVDVDDAHVVNFYNKLGFEKIKKINFAENKGHEYIYMSKKNK